MVVECKWREMCLSRSVRSGARQSAAHHSSTCVVVAHTNTALLRLVSNMIGKIRKIRPKFSYRDKNDN